MSRLSRVGGLPVLGQSLRQRREYLGLSQRAVAAAAGTTQAKVSRVENGLVNLRVESLIAFCKALDLSVSITPDGFWVQGWEKK